MGVPASGNVRLWTQVWLDEVLSQVVGNVEGALGVCILREGQTLHEILCPTPTAAIRNNAGCMHMIAANMYKY